MVWNKLKDDKDNGGLFYEKVNEKYIHFFLILSTFDQINQGDQFKNHSVIGDIDTLFYTSLHTVLFSNMQFFMMIGMEL